MAVAFAAAVAVNGSGAVAVAAPVAGLTKRFLNQCLGLPRNAIGMRFIPMANGSLEEIVVAVKFLIGPLGSRRFARSFNGASTQFLRFFRRTDGRRTDG